MRAWLWREVLITPRFFIPLVWGSRDELQSVCWYTHPRVDSFGDTLGGYDAITVYDIKPYVALGCRADAEDRIMGEIEEESTTEMTAEVRYFVSVYVHTCFVHTRVGAWLTATPPPTLKASLTASITQEHSLLRRPLGTYG